MKRVCGLIFGGLIVSAFVGMQAEPAMAQQAQQTQAQMTAVQQMFWRQIHAQDRYFNNAGSVLPQRYAAQRAPVAAAMARPASQPPSQVVVQAASPSTLAMAERPRPRGSALWGYVSELRFGVMSHDAKFPSRHGFDAPNPFENRYEGGVNLNPEVVFTSPDWLEWAWSPRPHVGVSVNTSGDTSSAYTGVNWDTAWDNGIFLDGFFGLAVHDGELHDGNPKGKIEFGSRVLFRLGGELGWRWDDEQGIALLWEHMSNGSIFASKNQGIDSLGLRYSYRFDSPY